MAKVTTRARRKKRIRKKLSGTTDRPRMSVFRTAKHIYAQVINDETGSTLCAASTLSKDVRGELEGNKTAAASKVGAAIAKACQDKGIAKVVFDRNGFIYHGRIKALAEAAREGGLDF